MNMTQQLNWQTLPMQANDDSVNHKFLLIIDFSWFLKSRIAVLNKTVDLSYEQPNLNDITDHQIMSKLTMDFCSDMRCMQHFVGDVLFAVDDVRANLWRSKHEWMKPFWMKEDETTSEDLGYKGTRQYDKAINWLQVYRAAFKWLDLMKAHHGVAKIKVSEAEADDVIALFAKLCLSKGRNVAWYGTDKDLTQICKTDTNTGAMAVYAMIKNGCKANNWAKTRLIACDKLAQAKLLSCKPASVVQPASIFDEMVGSANMQRLPQNPYEAVVAYADNLQVEQIPSFLFYKIVLGDAGDNVPELFAHMKKSGTKQCHLSIGCIYNALKSLGIETDNAQPVDNETLRYMTQHDLYDEELIVKFCDAAYKSFMKADSTPSQMLDWLVARFAENRTMVCLDEHCIPSNIVDNFNYTMSFWDFNKSSTNIDALCDFHSTFNELGLTIQAAAPQQADAKFADTFVNGLFGK